jgi:hypothetical protein
MHAQKRFLARNWLKAAAKSKPRRKPPSALSILCQTLRLLIACRKRLRELAPRLFDRRMVEGRILQHVARHPPVNSELPAAANAKILEDLASEAWLALSPADLAHVRFQWRFYQLLLEILIRAQTQFEQELQAEDQFSVFLAINRMLLVHIELRKSEHLWLPALPKSISPPGLIAACSALAEAPTANEIPFPPPPDKYSSELLEKARQWQLELQAAA